MDYEKIVFGRREFELRKDNLQAIQKLEERLSRRREQSTVKVYKEHLLDFFTVNKDVSYKEANFDHIDKFWAWKEKQNEKRKKQAKGRGVGRTTEKFSKQYINLITSILTQFFVVNNRSDFAHQIRDQERQTVYWKPMVLDAKKIEALRSKSVVRKGYELKKGEGSSVDEFYVLRDSLLIELLVSTGMRISEAHNLKREDVKLKVKYPHVVVTKAKRGSTRSVRVSERFVRLYNEFMALRFDNNSSVFTNKNGGQLSLSTLKTLFRQATAVLSQPDEFGRRETFGAHRLRHYYATYCVQLYPLNFCRQNLGHVSIEMTGRYVDKSKDLLKEKSPVDKIEEGKK